MAAFLAVLVPEADPVIGHLRARWDPSSRRGLGSHITIRYPFLPVSELRPEGASRLAEAVREVTAFGYTLARVSRFPGTVFLDPEPVAPFAALRSAIQLAFGSRLPNDSFPRYIPHLSVARHVHAAADVVLQQLDSAMVQGPIHARCSEVVLLERHGGPWEVRQRCPLRPCG